MQMKTHSFLAAACGALLAGPLWAATPLFDFEQEADLSAWKWASRGRSELVRTNRFATSGESALCFTSPAWQKGQPEWPAFETQPPVTNWNGFDRLVVDLTNPGEDRAHFALFISDHRTPFRQGLSYTFTLPSRGFRRFEVPLSSFPKEVNRGDIAVMHCFTERPRSDLTLFLDNLVLLRPGESAPEPGAKFNRQLAALTLEDLEAAERTLVQRVEAAGSLNSATGPLKSTPKEENPRLGTANGSPVSPALSPGVAIGEVEDKAATAELRQNMRARFARFGVRMQSLRAELAAANPTLARLNEINAEVGALPAQLDRETSILRFQTAVRHAGLPSTNLLVGLATSMEKILPRGASFDLQPAGKIEVSLARNEKESFQLVVLPAQSPLHRVTVSAGDLQGPGGVLFQHTNLQCAVVGCVETKKQPPYGASQVGWWPDPILDFLGPVEIAVGDLQSFWIRARAPKDQPPGVYRGRLTVAAEGVAPLPLDLTVRVYSFTLPDHSPLPLAITFSPEDSPLPETQAAQTEWRKSDDYPVKAWKKHRLAWADMLADYYISYDSLYHSSQPDFEVLTHLHQQGRLGPFNLGYYGHIEPGPTGLETWKASNLPRFRAAYAKAKELGLLDHAYIYGCDEAVADLFPKVQQAAAVLKAEFPDVLVMTTTYDQSYGMESVIKSMDAFCPLTPSFDPIKAARARAAGKEVWWYICCGPHHPHANMFIEYPAIEGRLLMGAMTARQRPDGFLYYQISIWNSRHPISSGPFTDWDPRSWTTYHGDGSWTCVGPDGTPLPTLRLENFRDGLEDYAYAVLLEDAIRRREAEGAGLTPAGQQWLAEAKTALAVPESLLKSMKEYSREPARLYAWRNQMAELIERSGVKDANPWGKNFGVRGFTPNHGPAASSPTP